MYTIIEIENRNVASTHTADTLTEAVYVANKLMDAYLKTFDLTIKDVDTDDMSCATERDPRASVDIYGSEWDAHVIRPA